MKNVLNRISAATPRIFAKIAAFSVALGVVSVAIFEAPYEIREMLPPEVFQAAKYFAVMAWALNLFSISQKEYEEDLKKEKNDVNNETDTQP